MLKAWQTRSINKREAGASFLSYHHSWRQRSLRRYLGNLRRKIMPLTMGYRALAILVVFLHLSFSSPVPARNKRHVDGMFTSEFSRARGSAAIRKIINSALAGKRDVEESSFQTDTNSVAHEGDAQRKVLSALTFNNVPDSRSYDNTPNEQEITEGQMCSAILYLLNRAPYQSEQTLHSQDY